MGSDLLIVSWRDAVRMSFALAARWSQRGLDGIYGIPNGGVPVALLASFNRGWRMVSEAEALENDNVLIVDDLVDSGRTMEPFLNWPHDALFRKPHSPEHLAPRAEVVDAWVTFPWEKRGDSGPEDAVVRLLEFVGEDPSRPGLVDTPARVLRSLGEMTAGYALDPADVLERTFDDRCDEMVVLNGIEFTSMCEHHMLPFVGTATVGYVPGQRVVGLSKLARLVDLYARRLQVQERMTEQIAKALVVHLAPRGVGVIVRAHHSCMGCRGVMKPTAEMVTSALHGFMKDDPKARAEFLAFAGN